MPVYQLFGKNGARMVPVQQTGLALGQVVSYGDMANQRQKAVITSIDGTAYGQPCIFVDTYSRSTVSITSIESPGGWEFENEEPWTVPQIRDLEAKAAQAVIDREQARQEVALEFKQEVANLIKDNPRLIPGQDRLIAAKNIRIELKSAFPGVKFSVVGKGFSGGNSIDVSWTDGPTSKQVDAITDKYSSGDFDGMTDCYNYRHSAWTEAFGSAKYVMAQRSYSDALAARVIETLIKKYGGEGAPTIEEYERGGAWNCTPIGNTRGEMHLSWQSLINVECSETDCTKEPVESADDDINEKIAKALEEQNRLLVELAKA